MHNALCIAFTNALFLLIYESHVGNKNHIGCNYFILPMNEEEPRVVPHVQYCHNWTSSDSHLLSWRDGRSFPRDWWLCSSTSMGHWAMPKHVGTAEGLNLSWQPTLVPFNGLKKRKKDHWKAVVWGNTMPTQIWAFQPEPQCGQPDSYGAYAW